MMRLLICLLSQKSCRIMQRQHVFFLKKPFIPTPGWNCSFYILVIEGTLENWITLGLYSPPFGEFNVFGNTPSACAGVFDRCAIFFSSLIIRSISAVLSSQFYTISFFSHGCFLQAVAFLPLFTQLPYHTWWPKFTIHAWICACLTIIQTFLTVSYSHLLAYYPGFPIGMITTLHI